MSVLLKRETKEFATHPAGGPYAAVCSGIQMHKDVETAFGVKDRIQITFETEVKERDHVEGVFDDRPMTVTNFVNATLNEKGRLMELLRQQIPADVIQVQTRSGQEFDVEQALIGTQWLLVIEHNETNGKVYANITNAMKAPESQELVIWEQRETAF